MARGGRVHLLLQHPLVDRADGVLRAAEDLRAHPLGLAEGELGDRAADPPLDPLGAEGDLVVALALAPLLRAVRVADRHPHDRDRRVDAAERDDAGDAAPGAHDHLAADLLAQDPVRRADVVAALGRDRRRLEPEPVLADRTRRLVHDLVLGRAAVLEREVEARELELDPDHVRLERTQPFLEQLLPGLVALEHDDRPWIHRRRMILARSGYTSGDGAQGWLEARGVEGAVPLPGRARESDRRPREDRANRLARDPACLEGRLDLAAARREAAGDRPRQGGEAPVPLPPGVPRPAGAGEVRQARPLRGGAARSCGRRWAST